MESILASTPSVRPLSLARPVPRLHECPRRRPSGRDSRRVAATDNPLLALQLRPYESVKLRPPWPSYDPGPCGRHAVHRVYQGVVQPLELEPTAVPFWWPSSPEQTDLPRDRDDGHSVAPAAYIGGLHEVRELVSDDESVACGNPDGQFSFPHQFDNCAPIECCPPQVEQHLALGLRHRLRCANPRVGLQVPEVRIVRVPLPLTAPERHRVPLPLVDFAERQIDPVRCSPFLGQLVTPPAHHFHDVRHGLRHHVVGVRKNAFNVRPQLSVFAHNGVRTVLAEQTARSGREPPASSLGRTRVGVLLP